ncbi:MAG TPA: hypothetical protein VIL91_09465 [Gaiellaceae bacterium]
MSAEEFEFFTRHAGGFDRQFFATNMPANHAAFLNAHGLTAQQVQVKVVLETGEELDVILARPALTWVVFDTEDREMHLVPMTAVRQVKFRCRPGAPAAVGFTVRPVEEEEAEAAQALEEGQPN